MTRRGQKAKPIFTATQQAAKQRQHTHTPTRTPRAHTASGNGPRACAVRRAAPCHVPCRAVLCCAALRRAVRARSKGEEKGERSLARCRVCVSSRRVVAGNGNDDDDDDERQRRRLGVCLVLACVCACRTTSDKSLRRVSGHVGRPVAPIWRRGVPAVRLWLHRFWRWPPHWPYRPPARPWRELGSGAWHLCSLAVLLSARLETRTKESKELALMVGWLTSCEAPKGVVKATIV